MSNFKNKYEAVVIGAGVSGLFAAIKLAENGKEVIIIEKMRSAGRKLLITGKGRCNITNMSPHSHFFKNTFPNGKFLKYAFGKFFNKDIVQFLNENGVETEVQRGERVFPKSEKSKDILDVFMKKIKTLKIPIVYNAEIKKILQADNQINAVEFEINNSLHKIESKNVIICTGGKSYPATGSTGDGYRFAKDLGHNIIKARPALVPLVEKHDISKQLQGLNLKNVSASLWIDNKKFKSEFGEMIFTHFGLSGPIILTLSRYAVEALQAKKEVKISIDLKPALDEQKLDKRLLRDIEEHAKKRFENVIKLWLPSKLAVFFLKHLKLNPNTEANQISAKERKKILYNLKNFDIEINDYRGYEEAIITSGGVDLDEINSKTMESKLVKGLYFAGEVIDLDAITGGFNLQIAYSTAYVAAMAIAESN
jgi:predicted Rossmann fold flavoprotein